MEKQFFDNAEQMEPFIAKIMKKLLRTSQATIIKNITVEQIGIPERTTVQLEGESTAGKFVQFYNRSREQFEVWKDGTYIRRLG